MVRIAEYGPLTFNGGGTAGGLKFKGSVAFEDLPTTGQEEGDMYNITNDFTLGGKHYVAGTNVAWTGTEWDALGGDTASLFITASSHTTVEGYEVPVLTDTQITNAYNGINAGKNVFIVDDLDTLTMQVLEASSIDSPEVSINVLFTDTLILTYLTGGEIEAKVLGGSGSSDWEDITNKPFETLGEGISANSDEELVNNFITGNYGKPKALTSVDLNTITNSGIYSCDSCTNRPNNSNGVMLVIKNAGTSDNLVQVYWTFQNDIMYVRHKDLGNWKTWIKTNNLTASDIMATNAQSIQANLERIDERIDDITVQYSSMPTPDADNIGKIVQYTGTTTSSFTQGHFYIVVSDGATEPTYSWQEISFGGAGGLKAHYLKIKSTWVMCNSTSDESYSALIDLVNDYLKNDSIIPLAYTYGQSINNGVLTQMTVSDYGNAEQIKMRFSTADGGSNTTNNISYKQISFESVIYVSKSEYTSKNITAIYSNSGLSNVNVAIDGNGNYAILYGQGNDYMPAPKKYVDDKPTTYAGYDATKTQVLKNVNGTLTWVDEA